MSLESLIWFLLIGLIAGWLAGKVIRGGGYGVLGISAGGLVGALITAFVGACLLILLLRAIRR